LKAHADDPASAVLVGIPEQERHSKIGPRFVEPVVEQRIIDRVIPAMDHSFEVSGRGRADEIGMDHLDQTHIGQPA
jgi:hypothetical protein